MGRILTDPVTEMAVPPKCHDRERDVRSDSSPWKAARRSKKTAGRSRKAPSSRKAASRTRKAAGQSRNASASTARDSSRAVHYYGRVDLKQLRPRYNGLFQWLDYQAVPPHPGAPPPYLSANLGGLLGALQPVEAVAVQRWVVNRTLHEEVVYHGEL